MAPTPPASVLREAGRKLDTHTHRPPLPTHAVHTSDWLDDTVPAPALAPVAGAGCAAFRRRADGSDTRYRWHPAHSRRDSPAVGLPASVVHHPLRSRSRRAAR